MFLGIIRSPQGPRFSKNQRRCKIALRRVEISRQHGRAFFTVLCRKMKCSMMTVPAAEMKNDGFAQT
ncbi:MAG TPA: hypothetical protein VGY77_12840, partial [Gemmataceae bacterium]|nr:hypothetical protein [Gemmataceae bacterium]